jgi:hypothetical protein
MTLLDADIRAALHRRLEGRYGGDPGVRVVDEMNVVGGRCRVDVAVINGRLEGFEIKSERDSLRRLARQAEAYGRVFDRMTIVCAERHLERTIVTVPSWWGVAVARVGCEGRLHLVAERTARTNRAVEPKAVACLLWRDEALGALEELGVANGLRSKPRRVLWEALAEELPSTKLRALVREMLRARRGWLAAG